MNHPQQSHGNHSRHWLWMLACCLAPVALLLALPLLGIRLRRETVWMHGVLQFTIGRVELAAVQRIRLRQAEQFEVGLGKVH